MKKSVIVGWAQPDKLARLRAAMQRPLAEQEAVVLHSHPGPGRNLIRLCMEVDLDEDASSVPLGTLLYESEFHPGQLLDEQRRYYRVAYINMVLHCPKCGHQHIDKPGPGWDNPPHKSHLCHNCKTIWRPADVPTMGVASIRTASLTDTWKPPK